MSEEDRYVYKKNNNGVSYIHDTYKDIQYDSMSDDFIKQINSDWESRQYQKSRREEAERMRDIAVTAVEGLLALEKLRNEWYITEFNKGDI